MKTKRLHNNAAPFIAYLQKCFRNDRGALAHLKGALSEARKPNAWPLLAGYKGAIGNPAYETLAALWACDPGLDCANGCLGDTLAQIKTDNPSFEGRFKRLLTCDREEISARVAPAVRAAQAKGIAINYTQLLSDLLWWGDLVKVEWAKAFWGANEPDDTINPDLLDKEEVSV
jgi:hypothetical protein